ncbi:MAG: hypothetical protein PHQ42_00190 [Patescibacteria group bacterium]|nr:hypothetical protein [Patescibacteria group bacterium]
MPQIFGGLFWENLVSGDEYFTLQQGLFRAGFIQGIQLRVAHPCFTPGLADDKSWLRKILSRLPGKEVVIHCGAENIGVDFGENFDELGVFGRHSSFYTWENWNFETLRWSLRIAKETQELGYNARGIVVHPGYGESKADYISFSRVVSSLAAFSGNNILLENVPPIVGKSFYPPDEDTSPWSRSSYWGFGGTPEDMEHLFGSLGLGWKCLIDFTHLAVMVNQAKKGFMAIPEKWKDINQAVADYLALPHSPVCHFSGIPPEGILIDTHDHLANFSPAVKEALRTMEIICLEIPFDPKNSETARQIIRDFRQLYL